MPRIRLTEKTDMESEVSCKMGTVIVGLVLVIVVALVVRSMVRDKKNGKSLQCGGECNHCGCHWGK